MTTASPIPAQQADTHDSLLAISLFAAFSNGGQCDAERRETTRDE